MDYDFQIDAVLTRLNGLVANGAFPQLERETFARLARRAKDGDANLLRLFNRVIDLPNNARDGVFIAAVRSIIAESPTS